MEKVRALYGRFPCTGVPLPLDQTPLEPDLVGNASLMWLVAGRYQCLTSEEDFEAAFDNANTEHMPKQWKPVTRAKFAEMQDWKQAKALMALAYGQRGLPIAEMSVTPHGDRQHEIEVETNWAEVLAGTPSALDARQVDQHEVWIVDGLFSEVECCALIEHAESVGFGATAYPKDYRGNLRLITTDRRFTEAVWQRLRALVPATMSLPDANGVWDAIGLNECWRLAKYYPGDVFKGHCDASFMRSSVEESMITVNIYMNGGFEGGSTRFYLDKSAPRVPSHSVVPAPGRCLLFRQPPGKSYHHDGEKLGSGLKYLFRSDVMYRRRS